MAYGYCRIDSECKVCDENFARYGCTNHDCKIWRMKEEGLAEMAADEEMDRRREDQDDYNKW